jgi:hypothetical protein
MHGSNMMFLFAVPVMEAMAVYLVPLMVGTRNIAFPRLNAFSYWMYLAGGLLLWGAFVIDMGPDVGWFAYVPLSGPQYAPGKRADIWAQMITFTEISALAVAIEIVVTVFKQRAPGMSLDRIPLFVWSMLVTAFLIIMAMPAIMVASTSLDPRPAGRHAFLQSGAGRRRAAVAALCSGSSGIPRSTSSSCRRSAWCRPSSRRSARRPVFGYLGMVVAIIATGILSFGLWVHHMFTGTAAARREFLHRVEHGDRGSGRRADLLLAGDAVGWPPGVQDAALVRHRLHRHFRDGRDDRVSWSPRCRSTRRCTTPISSSPISTMF